MEPLCFANYVIESLDGCRIKGLLGERGKKSASSDSYLCGRLKCYCQTYLVSLKVSKTFPICLVPLEMNGVSPENHCDNENKRDFTVTKHTALVTSHLYQGVNRCRFPSNQHLL